MTNVYAKKVDNKKDTKLLFSIRIEKHLQRTCGKSWASFKVGN